MTEIHSYQDNKTTCYANIRMDNGDPVYISIAQTGVVIKKSKVGLFGPKLFVSRDAYHAAKTAEVLDGQFDNNLIPDGYSFSNPVLKALVKACLSCSRIEEFTLLVNEALQTE